MLEQQNRRIPAGSGKVSPGSSHKNKDGERLRDADR